MADSSKAKPLGEFEQIVLLAVLQRQPRAYGVSVALEIEERAGREVSRGAVNVTLDRLEAKGLLCSRMSEPTPERGGRPKRFYEIEASGVTALRESASVIARMRQGLESLLGEP
jgi:DNA-binding PadR family transcriptional regulator